MSSGFLPRLQEQIPLEARYSGIADGEKINAEWAPSTPSTPNASIQETTCYLVDGPARKHKIPFPVFANDKKSLICLRPTLKEPL